VRNITNRGLGDHQSDDDRDVGIWIAKCSGIIFLFYRFPRKRSGWQGTDKPGGIDDGTGNSFIPVVKNLYEIV
jgi:hypothetical protein